MATFRFLSFFVLFFFFTVRKSKLAVPISLLPNFKNICGKTEIQKNLQKPSYLLQLKANQLAPLELRFFYLYLCPSVPFLFDCCTKIQSKNEKEDNKNHIVAVIILIQLYVFGVDEKCFVFCFFALSLSPLSTWFFSSKISFL